MTHSSHATCFRPCFVYLLWVTGMVTACRASPSGQARKETAPAPLAVVPLISVDGIPFISVRRDSAPPHLWLLDSGFGASVVNRRFADTLRLPGYTHGQATVPGGHTDVGSVAGFPLHIGEATFNPDNLAVIDLHNVEPVIGLPFAGILGHDFLMRYVVRLDYDHQQVQLFEPTRFAYAGAGQSLPLWIEAAQSFVLGVLYIDGRATPAKLKLDTGSFDVLGLNGSFVRQTDLVSDNRPKLPGMGAALGGAITGYTVRLDSMSLGGIMVGKPIAAYSTDVQRRGDAGTMGVRLLSRFNLVFDYPRHRVILEATERLHRPLRYDASGLLLTGAGPGYRSVAVLAVERNSPAAAAGIEPGDSIIMIGDKSAAAVGLSAIRDRLAQPDTVRLRLMHHGRTREVLLHLRERL